MRYGTGMALTTGMLLTALGCGGGGPAVPAGTDLKIPDISGDAFADWGNQLALDVTCRNHGRTDADADTLVRCYFSDNDTLESGLDVLLSSHSVTAAQMTAETELILNDTVTMPSSGAEGEYFLIYVIDEDDDVTEEIEDNNITVYPIYVGPKTLPDLLIVDVTGTDIDAPMLSGSSRLVSLTVRNTGVPTSQNCTVEFYISTTTTPSGSALAQRQLAVIGYMEDRLVTASLTVPLETTTNDYHFVAEVDTANVITEESESNNTNYSVQFYVRYRNPGDDQYEPDDFPEHADELPLTNSPQIHTSYPYSDEDWQTFTLTSTTTVQINVYNQTNGSDCETYLYDSSMTEVGWNWGDYVGSPYSITATLPAGTYYVMTHQAPGWGAEGGQYYISATKN